MAEQRREIVFEQESPRVCFGCGPDNPRGLGLRFFETEKGVEVDYRVEPHLVGAPGVVHGDLVNLVTQPCSGNPLQVAPPGRRHEAFQASISLSHLVEHDLLTGIPATGVGE